MGQKIAGSTFPSDDGSQVSSNIGSVVQIQEAHGMLDMLWELWKGLFSLHTGAPADIFRFCRQSKEVGLLLRLCFRPGRFQPWRNNIAWYSMDMIMVHDHAQHRICQWPRIILPRFWFLFVETSHWLKAWWSICCEASLMRRSPERWFRLLWEKGSRTMIASSCRGFSLTDLGIQLKLKNTQSTDKPINHN